MSGALGAWLGAPGCSPRTPSPEAPGAPRLEVSPSRDGVELALPPRPRSARGGEALFEALAKASVAERERAFEEEILSGNVPRFLRKLAPLRFELEGRPATLYVTPDYVSVGSDDDFVRVPLVVRTAARIAEATSSVFPTVEIVDAIYRAAELQVSSPPMAPGAHMASSRYFLMHHLAIEAQRRERGHRLGALLAGPKKDLVLTARSLAKPGRTPIYGWFRGDGSAIQPLSLLHDDHHVDYTHGLRLVHSEVDRGGERVRLLDHLSEAPTPALPEGGSPARLTRAWNELLRAAGAARGSLGR